MTADDMYKKYLAELSGYYVMPDNATVFDDGVGFAIVDRDRKNGNCHPLADMNITEFYIAPKCRRKGLGLKHAKELIAGSRRVSLMVIRKNEAAFVFWNKVFDSETWRCIEVTDEIDVHAGKNIRAFLFERKE